MHLAALTSPRLQYCSGLCVCPVDDPPHATGLHRSFLNWVTSNRTKYILLPSIVVTRTDSRYMLISCFDICKKLRASLQVGCAGDLQMSFIQCKLWMQLYLIWRPTSSEHVLCPTSMSNMNTKSDCIIPIAQYPYTTHHPPYCRPGSRLTNFDYMLQTSEVLPLSA